MSQMIKEQRVVQEESTGTRLLEEKLMDGSLVYNVTIFDDIIFHCRDRKSAESLFQKIDEQIPCRIH